MTPIIACPYCSSAYLQFDRFASPVGAVAAIGIVTVIAATPIFIRTLGVNIVMRPKKKWARRFLPYLAFSGMWIWFVCRMDLLVPAYNRQANVIQFSDMMLYGLFLPFIALWNYAVTPIAFFAPEWIAAPIGICWLVLPPCCYAWLSNRFDRDITFPISRMEMKRNSGAELKTK